MPKQKPSLILRGSFNPAIIRPRWLADQGIINALSEANNGGEQVDFKVEMRGFRAGTSGELRFDTEGISWTVSETRIRLDPGLAREAAPKLLTNVLKILPHTPVSGVGHNLSTTFTREEWKSFLPHLEPTIEQHLTALGSVASQAHAFSIAGNGNKLYNITIREDVTELVVDINIHYDIETIERAIEIIEKFSNDLDRAAEIAHNIATGGKS